MNRRKLLSSTIIIRMHIIKYNKYYKRKLQRKIYLQEQKIFTLSKDCISVAIHTVRVFSSSLDLIYSFFAFFLLWML